MTSSLRRFQLRERTALAHATVDSAIGAFDTLDAYRAYLASLHRFRAPLEALLDADWSAVLGDWRPGRIVPALRHDMAELGVPEPPPDPEPPAIARHSLMGTLYVLEGSALGARLLLPRAEALGLGATHGARHLALQCASPVNWRGFLDLLEHDAEFDIEQATLASLAAFGAAARAFGASRA